MPAHWGTSTLWALRSALRTNPALAPNGMPVRLVSDAVASLTALHANPGLPPHGVVALLDFGGGGTSITLADAAAAFEPIDETIRYVEFSGDQIDQALLSHVLDGIAASGGVDPAGTAAVGSLTRLRDECRYAKERLSAEPATEIAVELPEYRSTVRVTRTELETLIAGPLTGVLAALENVLERNRIGWPNVSAVVTVGGGASIPLITQRLSEHSRAPVVTTPQPALDAAVGAALFAAYGSAADAQTGVRAGAPAGGRGGGAPGSATFRALAWSQDDDAADEPVPYTDEDPYATDIHSMRSPAQYVPATGPIDEPRTWHRLPQLVFGVAAVVALVALGGVAIALTSATDSTRATDPPGTATPRATDECRPPPPPSPHGADGHRHQRAAATAATTHDHGTCRRRRRGSPRPRPPPRQRPPRQPRRQPPRRPRRPPRRPRRRPRLPTTTPMTTTYLTVPFVPVPIPIQVPQNPYQPVP